MALCLCCCMLFTGISAKAATFSFVFTSLENQDNQKTYSKSNNHQYYKITIDQKNPISGISNNMSSNNIFGEKLHRLTNDDIDVYHTFSNFVSNYQINYKTTVSPKDKIKMVGKKDSASTSGVELRVTGSYTP